jgi:hypothetical protein
VITSDGVFVTVRGLITTPHSDICDGRNVLDDHKIFFQKADAIPHRVGIGKRIPPDPLEGKFYTPASGKGLCKIPAM